MNTNNQSHSAPPTTIGLTRRLTRGLEAWWLRQTKIAVATYFFGFIVWILGWFIYAEHLAALKLQGHPSLAGERFFCEYLPWITLVFFVVWTFLCFRWRKVRQGDKKVSPQTFLFMVLITLWLSLFMAVSPCTAANPVQTDTMPQMSQTVQIASTQAANDSHPNFVLCEVLLAILYLVATAVGVYVAWLHYCELFRGCGNTGKKPPQSPPKGTNQTQMALSPLASSPDTAWPINTNVGLPAISFAIQDGVIVSNSAGMNILPFPSFISSNGIPVGLGALVTSSQPGFTTPPSISVWAETNFYADTNLDPVYPYVALFNYTLLTTTNLATGWHELCTVIGWGNSNPSVPLTCMISYTNGVPETTNWIQAFLDQYQQPTNVVVYGTLPLLGTTNSPANLLAVRPADGPPIPPGGGGSTNSVPFSSSGQFFRLTCNTNAIVTSWP